MPPKKQSKSGYWQYAMSLRNMPQHSNMTMTELQDYAGRKWMTMSRAERQPYEDRASLARNKATGGGRFTSEGLDIEVLERQQQEAINSIQRMKSDITNNLKMAQMSKTLQDEIFLIIHINHLTYHKTSDYYYICEIAIAAFSLRNGIEQTFHEIVLPGKLPLGFQGHAVLHSKETHQLFHLACDEEKDNTETVFKKMLAFMNAYTKDGLLPILYTNEKVFEMTRKVMDTFTLNYKSQKHIKVYQLEYMFFALKNAAAGRMVWPTESFSDKEISKDVYAYTTDIACEYHENIDVVHYCSKSIATRYAFTICDNCCPHLNIKFIAGRHVPLRSINTVQSSAKNSRKSSVSSTTGTSAWNSVGYQPMSAGTYDAGSSSDFPPLSGSSKGFPALAGSSTASSAISGGTFRSLEGSSRNLKEKKNIDNSNNSQSLNEIRRDLTKLRFPEKGFKDA